MEIRETIHIKGDPFPNPLPLPAADIVALLADHGYVFEDMGMNMSVMLNEPYSPKRLCEIEATVEAEGWQVRIEHSVWPVYNDQDYAVAPLWVLRFPDLWIDEINFSTICDECGKTRTHVDTSKQVPKVGTKKPVVSVNGQFEIVNVDLKKAISESLTGACFYPFDEQGRYFYLTALEDLGELICRRNEFIDLQGRCPRCGLPKFRIFFGPLRYSQDKWSGQDIVHGDFHEGNLFTPNAYELLKSFESKTVRDGVAFLEEKQPVD